MIWKRWTTTLILTVLAVVWTGCDTPAAQDDFVCVDDEIRIGDTLNISLLDTGGDNPEKQFVVRSDGSVNLSLLGSVKASGKKFGDFEKELQKEYVGRKLYVRVTVVVKPGERFYSVAGEVKGPGRQIYTGPTTVLRAITTCGDFNEFANRRKVEVTRANGKREIVDCKKAINDPKFDRPICPGDHIRVPKSL